jgi:hypothetical protein
MKERGMGEKSEMGILGRGQRGCPGLPHDSMGQAHDGAKWLPDQLTQEAALLLISTVRSQGGNKKERVSQVIVREASWSPVLTGSGR